jgi:hypothetical protein
MKKALLAVGMILLLTGIILLSATKTSYESVETTHEIIRNQEVWSMSKTISVPTNISLSFRPDSDWSIPAFEEPWELPPGSNQTYNNVKQLEVNITNPQGNFTTLGIYLVCDLSSSTPVTIFPDYFSILDQSGGITVDSGYPKVGYLEEENVVHLGKTHDSGLHVVTLVLPYELQDEEVVKPTGMQYDWVNVTDNGDNIPFSDEFNDYNWTSEHWTGLDSGIGEYWNVSDGHYTYYSSGEEGVETTYVENRSWTDCTIETSAAFGSGVYGPRITARFNATSGERYSFGVYPDARAGGPNKVRLWKFLSWSRPPIQLAEAEVVTDTNWHILKMTLNGSSIECYYDNVLVIDVEDHDFTSGLVGLEAHAKASLLDQRPPSPPIAIALYETVSNTIYPYSQLLYIGLATTIVGVAVVVGSIIPRHRRKADFRKRTIRK